MEAKIVVCHLVEVISELFVDKVRTIVFRNHGAVSTGKAIHHARAAIELPMNGRRY
ncbi:MAG TPA: hypothetical protein VFI73_11610 [Candidatus Nitrosopolaris sp.]|nr:hypothetical protein [Candidatus Nitrosopolaris sp.]